MSEQNSSLVQCDTLPCYYHGSPLPLTDVMATRRDEDGFALYLSASANLARRYGPYVTRFTLLPSKLMVLPLRKWGSHGGAEEETADAVVVLGDKACYDFQADMLAVKNASVLRFVEVLSAANLALLDDGLPMLQDPAGPVDRGWDVWVKDRHDGDLAEALSEVGWAVDDGPAYRLTLPADRMEREWVVRVYPRATETPLEFGCLPADAWIVESNFGESGAGGTLEEALAIADAWSRERRRDREALRRPVAPREHAEETVEDEDELNITLLVLNC